MDGYAVPVTYLASAQAPPDPADRPSVPEPDNGALTFGSVLSALNPLQHLPVIGTIYRAVTGDTIPEGLRIAGSFLFSGLTGGPFGLLLNAVTTVAERVLGVDPEAIARDVAEGLGIGGTTPAAASSVQEAGATRDAQTSAAAATAERATEVAPVGMADRQPVAEVSDAQRRAGLASYARVALA